MEASLLEAARRYLAAHYQGTLEVRSFELNLWRLEARLEGLALVAHRTGGRLSVTLESGLLRFHPGILLAPSRAAEQIAILRLRKPEIEIDGPFSLVREEEATAVGELRLQIGELNVVDALVRIDDQKRAASLNASLLSVTGIENVHRPGWSGRLVGEIAIQESPIGKPLPLTFEARYAYSHSRIRVLGLDVAGPGIEIELTGNVEWGDELRARLEGNASFLLDEVAPYLDSTMPTFGGTAEMALHIVFDSDGWLIEGPLLTNDIRVDDLHAVKATARLGIDKDSVTLDSLEAELFGGSARGRVEIGFAGPTTIDLEVDGEAISSVALLEWLDLPLPLASRLTTSFRLAGVLGDRKTWDAAGTFDGEALMNQPESLPTAVRGGEVAFDAGRMTITAEMVEVAAASLTVEGLFDLGDSATGGRILLEGSTVDAARTQAGVAAIVDRFDTVLPDAARWPISGQGWLRAEIPLDDTAPQQIDLDLRDGGWGLQEFDHLQLSLISDGTILQIPHLLLQLGEQQLEGSVSIDLGRGVPLETDLSLDQIYLGFLLEQLDLGEGVSGIWGGELSLRTVEEELQGGGSLTVEHWTLLDQPIRKVSARIEARGQTLLLHDLHASGDGFELRGSGGWDLNRGEQTLEIRSSSIELGGLALWGDEVASVAGQLSVTGRIDVRDDGLHGLLEVGGSEILSNPYELGDFSGSVTFAGDLLTFEADAAGVAGWQVEGNLLLVESLPAALTVRLVESPLRVLHESLADLDGRVSGEFDLRVSLEDPDSFELEGRISAARASFGAHELALMEPFELKLGPDEWRADGIRLGSGDTQLRINVRSDPTLRSVTADLHGRINLAMLSAIAPEIRAAGTATIDLEAAYSEEGLDLDGSIQIDEGRVRWLGFPETIAALNGRMQFRDSQLIIDSLAGRFGGGELQLRGGADLHNPFEPILNLEASAVNVRLDGPDGFRGIYDAELSWNKTAVGQKLAGRVELLRGLYEEPFDFTGSGSRAVRGSAIEGLPPDLDLNIELVAESGVWIRNDLLEAELKIDLALIGSAGRPELAGRVVLREGGQVEFRDVDYRILNGTLDFSNQQFLDPYLTFHAITQVAEYAVHLRVEGTASHFEYDLTSTPSLAQQDIIALLTTGRTLQDLSGRSGSVAFTGDLAANYFAGALTSRLTRQLERVLGLERFRIDPLLGQEDADPTARVTIGKAVTDDIFVIFSTDLNSTENQRYEVEWRLSRKTRASASRGMEGGIGGDIQYYDRYWWKKPTAEEPTPAAVAPAGVSGVSVLDDSWIASIRIVGLTGADHAAALRRVEMAPGDRYRRSTMFAGLESLRRMLVAQGRLEAEIEAVATPIGDGSHFDVEFWVNRGRMLRIEYEGIAKKSERERIDRLLLDRWSVVVFSDDLYHDAVEVLLRDYHSRGYYAADVQQYERIDDDGTAVCVFSVDRGPAVRLRTLEIEGVEKLSIEEVRGQLLTRTSSLLQRGLLIPSVLRDDIVAIRHLYRDQGFLDVVVSDPTIRLSSRGDTAAVTITVQEGESARMGKISFSGETSFSPSELADWAGVATGQIFSPRRLLEAESELRAAFDSRGYPDARVRAMTSRDDGGVHIEFILSPGFRQRLQAVEIVGAAMTRESVIRRAIQVEPGELLSREALLRTQHELYRMGIFSNVSLSTEAVAGSIQGENTENRLLRIRVEESRPLATAIGIGYDSEGGERISFSATHQNVGGRNRTLSLQGHASDVLTRVQIVSEAPHLLGWNDPVLTNFSVEDRDEIGFKVQRNSAAIRFDRRRGPDWKGFLRYNFQKVSLRNIEDALAVSEEKLENLRLGDLGLTLLRDTRDDPFLPRRGTYGSLSTRIFAPVFGSEVSFAKTQFTLGLVHTFTNQITLAGGLRVGLAEPFGSTERVPLSERFFAGGDSTLRGFGRDEVGPQVDGLPTGGEALFLFNEEMRFPLHGAFKGVLFYDAGNIYSTLEDFDPFDLRHVLGIGIRYETAIGPLRMEYGRKLDRLPGESDGEWFIAIGSAF